MKRVIFAIKLAVFEKTQDKGGNWTTLRKEITKLVTVEADDDTIKMLAETIAADRRVIEVKQESVR